MAESTPSPRVVRFGAFDLDLSSGELHKQGLKIKLQQQPFQVLEKLLQHPGHVVTREELRKTLWPTDTFIDFDHSLGAAINRIREALGDSADNPRFVETLPRRGYRFIAPVSDDVAAGAHESTTPEPRAATQPVLPLPVEKPAAEVPPPSAARRRVHPAWIAVAIFAGLLLLLAGLNSSGWRQRPLARAGAPRIESIAVLPLENLSGDPGQEYFVDGMTDALITDLAQVSALRVISRTSVMGYKGARKPLREIGRELNVEAVLEGTVMRSGQRVRVTAQLVHAPTDRHLWAKSYERDLSDIMALQADVARAIVTEIGIKLTPQDQTRLARTRPVNPQAYEAYLRGLYFWNKRSDAALLKSIEYFEQAIAKDPKFALAYAGLADSYTVLGFEGGLSPNAAFPKAKAAVGKALEIDDTLAEAHMTLASIRRNIDWDSSGWSGAEKEFKRAIELNPGYAMGHIRYAFFLRAMGRNEEALAESQRANELDPVSLVTSSHAARYIFEGQYDQAIEVTRKKLELYPDLPGPHAGLGEIYLLKRQFPEAIAEFQKAVSLSERAPRFLAHLGNAFGVSGQRQQAIKVLDELREQAKRRYVSPYEFALVYTGLGEKEQAFAWLQKAHEDRSPRLILLKVDQKLDSLRSDPRYTELERRIGLPP